MTRYGTDSELSSGDDEQIRLACSQELRRLHEEEKKKEAEQPADGEEASKPQSAGADEAEGAEDGADEGKYRIGADDMDSAAYEEMYDASFKDDRIKKKEKVGLKENVNYDGADDPSDDLFQVYPHDQDIMAIMEVLNQTWFVNLVFRLRSLEQFSLLSCMNGYPSTPLARLTTYAEGCLIMGPSNANLDAAAHADLLNNVDRFLDWTQQTALECICTEAQIEAYDKYTRELEAAEADEDDEDGEDDGGEEGEEEDEEE